MVESCIEDERNLLGEAGSTVCLCHQNKKIMKRTQGDCRVSVPLSEKLDDVLGLSKAISLHFHFQNDCQARNINDKV